MRRSRALTVLATVGLVGSLVVGPVAAQPSSDEVRDDLQGARERLQELEMEAAVAVEEYNRATVAAEEAAEEREATEAELERLGTRIDRLSEAAGDHARRLHKLGPAMELSPVFTAGDLSDVGARSTALRHVLDGQRADLEELTAARAEAAAAEERLAEQVERAEEREAELAGAREEVEATLATHSSEIEELEQQLAAAEEREAEEQRRAEAERRAEAQREAEQREAEQREAAQGEQEEAAGSAQAGSSDDDGTAERTDAGGGGDAGAAREPAPSARQSASAALDTALDQVGKPYRYGASGPGSYDCSGLTSYAWRAAGVDITRTSRSQWHATSRVSRSELQAGDLVFYSRNGTPSGIGHVAMYTGRGGEVVEAPYSGQNVRVRGDGLSRSDILGYGRP